MRRISPFLLSVLLAAACTAARSMPPSEPTSAPAGTALATSTPALNTMDLPAAMPQTSLNMPATPLPTSEPVGSPAPAIVSNTWLNSQPLDWNSLRGQVVMVEFWTFDCINCRHVIPYLKGMDLDYRKQGLTIIGVHSPEFDYEHNLDNVKDAIQKMGIKYPVAIDNDFANWNRYQNLAWPALYLIDKRGMLRYSHIGEGAYDETRQWIEQLLKE